MADRGRQLARWIALGGCLGLAGCWNDVSTRPTPVASGENEGHKILMMHYMPGYETPAVRGKWGNHWTGRQRQHHPDQIGEKGLPDIWSNYHPLIGPY